MAGRFISLEGGEGAGKSTQLRRLAEALRARGIAVIETREPGGSAGAEAIRALLLEGEGDRWGAGAEALLFAAARADHIAKTIRPALAAGSWVLCDRFLDSSRAYQGVGSGLGDDAILSLHRIGSAGFLPDRTLLLQLPPALAAEREAERDGATRDRIAGRGMAYHDAVADAFRRMAAEEPARFRTIDARGAPADVTGQLLAALEDML